MKPGMMDTPEGREAFFYELYPIYASEAGWDTLDTQEAVEAERRTFAMAQAGATSAMVARVALRHLLSLLPENGK